MRQAEGPETRQNSHKRPLISHSSILVLSCFAIGMASRQALPASFEAYAFAVGTLGLIVYVTIDFRKSRQDEKAAAADRATQRMQRYVPRVITIRRKSARTAVSDSQYLPVVQSRHRRTV